MIDRLTKAQRSAHMSKVKSKGNRSTELRVLGKLVRERVCGWTRHPKNITGNPDFVFPKLRIVLFVDGCFWHGCPHCKRNTPFTRSHFWAEKINGNQRRDKRNTKLLRQQGFQVIRIWEHELDTKVWFDRLRAVLDCEKLVEGIA